MESTTQSVLLSDKAIRAIDEMSGEHVIGAEQLVHYHATEGREALVEKVAAVLLEQNEDITPHWARQDAEAVVSALFGPSSSTP